MNRSITLALALWLALFAGAAGADPIEFEIEAHGPISVNGLELVPEGSMTTIGISIDISAGGPPPPPPDTTAPEPPTDLVATPGDNQVTLTWTASVSEDVEDYAIERAFDDGFPIYIPLASGVSASPYVDSTAVNGNDYLYKVRAFDEADNASEYAGPVSVTPGFDPTGMDNIVAWFTAKDADSVNESETSAGQPFWLNKVDSAPNALVVSASANPGYTEGESVDCASSDTLDFSQDLGSLHDIYLTLKVSSGAFGYLFRESSGNYISLTQSSNTIVDRISGDSAIWNNSTDGMTFPLDEWFVLQIRRDDATNFSLFLNGTLVAQKFSNVSPPANQVATTLVNSLSGVSFGDIVVFSANVPSEDQATLTADLKTRYGIE